jgi:ribosomal protein L11 methyltransferase
VAWLLLSVAVDREQVDAATELLESGGALAVTLSGAGEEQLLEPLPGQRPLWRDVRLQALLEPSADLARLRLALAPAGARLVDLEFLGDDDWQDRWRAYAVKACFGGRLWLLPRDKPLDALPLVGEAAGATAAEPVVLRLDPGLAFGSGSHPTTRLCLTGLAEQPLQGARVLDFGCGSGVLALAACLLGAAEVVAVDHDPQALLATRENAAYNSIGPDQLQVLGSDEFTGGGRRFDVVVANILANPLVELAPLVTALVAPRGLLMLSGLLAEQESMIRTAYPDVVFDSPAREAEWIRLDGRLTAQP